MATILRHPVYKHGVSLHPPSYVAYTLLLHIYIAPLYTHLSDVYIGAEAFLARLNERRSYYRLAVTHLCRRQESRVPTITKISRIFNRAAVFRQENETCLSQRHESFACLYFTDMKTVTISTNLRQVVKEWIPQIQEYILYNRVLWS